MSVKNSAPAPHAGDKASSTSPALALDGVMKSFAGRTVLQPTHLTVMPGEKNVIIVP